MRDFLTFIEDISTPSNAVLMEAIVKGYCVCHPEALTEASKLAKLGAALGLAGTTAFFAHPFDRYNAAETQERYDNASQMITDGSAELDANNCNKLSSFKKSKKLPNHDGFYSHYTIPEDKIKRMSADGAIDAQARARACTDASLKVAEGNAEMEDIYANNYQDLINAREKYN